MYEGEKKRGGERASERERQLVVCTARSAHARANVRQLHAPSSRGGVSLPLFFEREPLVPLISMPRIRLECECCRHTERKAQSSARRGGFTRKTCGVRAAGCVQMCVLCVCSARARADRGCVCVCVRRAHVCGFADASSARARARRRRSAACVERVVRRDMKKLEGARNEKKGQYARERVM